MSELIVRESGALYAWDKPEKLELIKNTLTDNLTADEFMLYIEVARSSGLNPLQKQIYAIKRGNKLTIQTGIDGYRLIAARTGRHMGTIGPKFEMRPNSKYPESATVIVQKLVNGQIVSFEGTAYWDEYVQEFNGKIAPMWMQRPKGQLGKCAEALALRRSFPEDLSGIYTTDEMMQADNDNGRMAYRKEGSHIESRVIETQYDQVKIQKSEEEEQENLLVAANRIALEGMNSLKEYWSNLSVGDKQYIGEAGLDRLKKIATQVDASIQSYEATNDEDEGS
jgi:phage recombination protein Bet